MTMERKFALGQLIATPGVLELFSWGEILGLVARHAVGDWGDLCDEDKATNNAALRYYEDSGEFGGRLFSAYDTLKGRIWIITEADRTVTTALLPQEY